jgi:uncharacterized protein (DUF1501 family)
MALTRRQFLKRSGLAAAGGFLGPGLLNNALVQRALADTIGDRYFVVLFLDGGNDGLNTVTPIDDGGGTLRTAYDGWRHTGVGGINLTPGELAPFAIGADPATGAQLGLHPGLADLKTLYDLGKVAVIQNCGYPNFSLSHDDARRTWQTASPDGSAATGWIGRYLAANYIGTDIPAAAISGGTPREFAQGATSVLTVRRVRDFRFPYDGRYGSDIVRKRDTFNELHEAARISGQPPILTHIGNAGTATLLSTEAYPALHDTYQTDRASWSQAYSDNNSSMANDLREIAKIIYGVESSAPNINARFFQLRNGGYDTHSDQGGAASDGSHFRLHQEVASSLKLFYDDLADMGAADKVCVLVWSEFSRRVPQNDNGTDHGSQGPTFVLGGGVTGGVYGNHPNIEQSALDNSGNTVYSQDGADPFRTTDLRDIYGTILKHWLNMDPGQIASSVLPADGGNPATRWTTQNFDVGFLP